MADRKVLNKYIHPDFDPAKLQPSKDPSRVNNQSKVRLMAPFSMRCTTCGVYIYKGTKFNARKETVTGEQYLSIKIYRFYLRCPKCAAELTFKSDPKNADYVAEHGIQRNFEAWREDKTKDEMSFKQKMEEELDPMRRLENSAVDSKREIDILEVLDEVRTRNAIYERLGSAVDLANVVKQRHDQLEAKQAESEDKIGKRRLEELHDEEDAQLAALIFRDQQSSSNKRRHIIVNNTSNDSKQKVSTSSNKNVNNNKNSIVKPIVVKKKPATVNNADIIKQKQKPLSLVANYDSD